MVEQIKEFERATVGVRVLCQTSFVTSPIMNLISMMAVQAAMDNKKGAPSVKPHNSANQASLQEGNRFFLS